MTKALAPFACLFALAISVSAEEPYQFQKEVSAASKAEEMLLAVPLDADVYAATQDNLADLRLQTSDGKTVPYLIRKAQDVKSKTVRRQTWTAVKPTLRPLDDGGLEITLTLDKDDPHPNGLSLISPLKNFEQRVRIQTSADGQSWEPAFAESVIFDYSRYMDVRKDEISFPATARKRVRILIDDVTSEQESELLELTRHLRGTVETERVERTKIDRRPFRIDRIDFWREDPQIGVKDDHKQSYPAIGFSTSEDTKTQQTIVTIDTHREPLTQITIQTASRNFSRNCVVQVQEQHGVQTTWRQIGAATLSQLDFKSLKREQLAIVFPETRNAKYRLVIDNRDSQPLEITGIQLEGNVYEVVYLSATNKPHRLMYNNANAKPPEYDTEAMATMLSENVQPESVTLGSQQKMVGAVAGGFKFTSLLNDPRILTGIIGLLVLVLGWGLYGAVKRIDPLPPTEPPAST